jgi:hypothetical protein
MENVWSVDGPNGRVPIVHAHGNLAELVTKTKVLLEGDDTNSTQDPMFVWPRERDD